MACRRLREQGFALVEALVSLVIVAMIALLLAEGVGTGRRVWERIDRVEAAGEAIASAQGVLRDRIEQMYPATLYDKYPPYVEFEGANESLDFVSSPPHSGRPAPLFRYRLSLTPRGDLVLGSVSDVAATDQFQSQVLLSGVRRLELAYFGAAEPDQARRWRPSWSDQPHPPELVRVRIELEPRDRRWWPDLLVRPRATIDSACVLETARGRCRGRP